MKCKKCGTEVDDRAKFCPVCGEPMGFGSAPHAPEPPRPNYSSSDYGNSGGYRAPIAARSIPMAIILSIITCGIYGIYWMYCLVNDLNTALPAVMKATPAAAWSFCSPSLLAGFMASIGTTPQAAIANR